MNRSVRTYSLRELRFILLLVVSCAPTCAIAQSMGVYPGTPPGWIVDRELMIVGQEGPPRPAALARPDPANGWLAPEEIFIGPPEPLSLARCVAMALDRNTSIARARKAVEKSEGVLVQIRSGALPRIKGNMGYTTEDEALSNGGFGEFGRNPNYWSTGIRLEQAIYNAGRLASETEAARLEQLNSFQEMYRVVDEVLLEVRMAFYDVLLNEALIRVQEQSQKLLEEELANQRRRFDVGLVTKVNVLRAEVEVANSKPELIRARNAKKLSLVRLARLLGYDYQADAAEEPPFRVAGDLVCRPVNVSLAGVVTQALSNRPEVRVAERQVRIREHAIRSAKSGYYPTFSLFAGYDVLSDRQDKSLTEKDDGWSVGIQGTWDIFDGLYTEGKVKESTTAFDDAILAAEEIRREVHVEAREAVFRLHEAVQLIESQKKNVEQAEESLRLVRARQRVGAGTQLEVLDSQVALTEARTNELRARYDYHVALAKLERVTSAPLVFSDDVSSIARSRLP